MMNACTPHPVVERSGCGCDAGVAAVFASPMPPFRCARMPGLASNRDSLFAIKTDDTFTMTIYKAEEGETVDEDHYDAVAILPASVFVDVEDNALTLRIPFTA